MRIASVSTDLLDTRAWNFFHLEQWWIYMSSPLFSWGLKSESEWKCFLFHTDVVGYCKDTPQSISPSFLLGLLYRDHSALAHRAQILRYRFPLGMCAVPTVCPCWVDAPGASGCPRAQPVLPSHPGQQGILNTHATAGTTPLFPL